MTLPRSLRTTALLALLGLTAAVPPPDAQQATIRITLNPAGVQVSPARVAVAQGTPLEWTSDLPFAVDLERKAELFGSNLPPQALRGRAAGGGAAAGAARRVMTRVGESAPPGTYKYSVAVWDGENVWVVDPEIVVRPR